MAFEFEKQKIEDVILIKPRVFGDNRGFFMETFKKSEFAQNGITNDFIQDNHSKSSKGVLRGLHYQAAPHSQAKIVRCVKGRTFRRKQKHVIYSKRFCSWFCCSV